MSHAQTDRPDRAGVSERPSGSKNGLSAGAPIGTGAVITRPGGPCGVSLPFYWMLVLAFRNTAYTFDTTPFFTHVTLSNFKYAFNTSFNQFGRSLVNSLLIGAVVTLVAMTVGVFAGYAMARLTFRGKGLVLAAILGASMFPGVAILTPLFQLFTNLGWLGTYHALILPQISFSLPLAVYTLTSFFSDMPWELEQAARVDGATPGRPSGW